MTPTARTVVAVFNVYLLLSIHPIDAKRVTSDFEHVSSAMTALHDLEEALQEDLREEAMSESRAASSDEDTSYSSVASGGKDVCGKKWLMVRWKGVESLNESLDDGQKVRATTKQASGAYRLESWDAVELFRKVDKRGCLKVYTAMCAKGGVSVTETCPDKEAKTTLRSLTGWIHSRNSDIHRGETISLILHEQSKGSLQLASGEVEFNTVDPDDVTESCLKKKDQFVARVGEVRSKLIRTADKRMSELDAAGMVLKARRAVKSLHAAKKEACDWVLEKSVDKAPLEDIVRHTAARNPCFEKAKQTLLSSKAGTAEEQHNAFRRAMEQLLSDTCGSEADADSELERLDHDTDLLSQKLNDVVVDDLGGDGGESESAGDDGVQASLAQAEERLTAAVASQDLSGDALGEILGKILGFVFLGILWALFCWVLMIVVMAILGLILCTLKSMIVFLINVFKKNKWESDWSGCMGWWLGALGHVGDDGLSISICAASMMTGMVM